MRKIRVLMIGPLPPNVGGIASYIDNLIKALRTKQDIEIMSISPDIVDFVNFKSLTLKVKKISLNIISLINLICQKKVDIIHIHTSSNVSFLENSIYIIIIRLLIDLPIILHIHSGDFDSFIKNIYLKFFIKRIINSCKVVIVLSPYWKAVLSKTLNKSVELHVIPNAASPNFFPIEKEECRNKIGLPKKKSIILSLGKLVESKGFHYLIDAIYILKQNNFDILCFIGGAGKMESILNDKISQLGLDENVKLLGIIRENNNLWMNSADLIVLPSLSEGVPIVMLEALNCGRPFIGTSVGGIPDIIISENYGFLVEPANAEDLAEKIKLAINKNWDREIIIHYSKKFTFDNISEKLMRIYRQHLID